MLRSKSFLALITVIFIAGAIGQERPKARRSQIIYALAGPIHTQLNSSKKLNEDPREKPTLYIREPEGWLEFDPSGELVESGSVDASGKITTRVREKHDAAGHPMETTIIQADAVIHHRIENDKLKEDTTETRVFENEKLMSRIVNTHNSQTGDAESTTFDAQDNVINHSTAHRSPVRQEAEVYGKDEKFVIHSLRRLDDKGELIESLRYDPEGKVASDLSFKDGVLTSWWQDPKCDCTNRAGFHRPDGTTVLYSTTNEGKLLKNIQRHKGRPTNHEIDDEELYDENNHLLERVAYAYQRDAHGNWTECTVSVLDLKTGIMAPVRKDTRELTYY